jgi:demethylsterigmatocystin 6-O-methyltransferase
MRRGYSKVLINDFAIPDRNACAFAMRSDFMVMALAGSVERTEGQWRELLAAAGLKVNRIWTAEPESQSILEASLVWIGCTRMVQCWTGPRIRRSPRPAHRSQ